MTYLSDIRTVKSAPARNLAPVKPIDPPALSLAEDAARCNARLKPSWGEVGNANLNTSWGNAIRHRAARERDEAMFPVILAILQDGPKSRIDIARGTGLSDDVSKRVLQRMKADGLITGSGQHKIKWSIAQ